MLHVDIPTQSELLALAVERAPASVSIYLPTTSVSGEISGDRIALKNLAKEAVDQLEAAGHDKREIAEIAAHLDHLVEDDSFWRFQAHSLAVFATPAKVKTYRVPNALTPMVKVSDRFHLKPLLRAVTFSQVAYVLALAEGSVRLLEVTPDQPAIHVPVHGLPSSAAEALGRSSMGVSTESRRSDSASGQRASLAEFARIVDRALRGLLAGQHVPLFLAADPTLSDIYRSVNSYPHLAPFGLEGTPADMNDAQIVDAARGLLDRLHAAEVDAIRKQYAERGNSGRATSDIAQAARAATHGAIATLLVDIDHSEPGLIDEETGAVTFADAESATTYGVVDEIARRALLTGARVLAVRASDLPEPTPLAAILRYAF
jgi:hypothetical protein